MYVSEKIAKMDPSDFCFLKHCYKNTLLSWLLKRRSEKKIAVKKKGTLDWGSGDGLLIMVWPSFSSILLEETI